MLLCSAAAPTQATEAQKVAWVSLTTRHLWGTENMMVMTTIFADVDDTIAGVVSLLSVRHDISASTSVVRFKKSR